MSKDLLKRLRATRRTGPPSWIDIPLNPNGEEAAVYIEFLQTQLTEWKEKHLHIVARLAQEMARGNAAETQLSNARDNFSELVNTWKDGYDPRQVWETEVSDQLKQLGNTLKELEGN
jgi:hypothetical protein